MSDQPNHWRTECHDLKTAFIAISVLADQRYYWNLSQPLDQDTGERYFFFMAINNIKHILLEGRGDTIHEAVANALMKI